MSNLAAALMVAIRVHAGQVDKQREPYLLHVLRVVEAVSDEGKIVAALHDVLEDGPPGVQMQLVEVLDDDEMQALLRLTRNEGYPETYAGYIAAIARLEGRPGRIAREVKLADLRDNLGRIPERVDWKTVTWGSLKARYEKAVAILETLEHDKGKESCEE